MSLPSKKKSSKREDQRRLATFKVNNCRSTRQEITCGELSKFVQHIEGNNGCQFGIVRLCELKLDTLYSNPKAKSEKSTLIRFAAKLGRDGIVASFIRGGADPTVFSCICATLATADGSTETSCNGVNGARSSLSAFVRKKITSIPFPLAVWFIRTIIRNRTKYISLCGESANQKKQESFWQKNHEFHHVLPIKLTEPEQSCAFCRKNDELSCLDSKRYNCKSSSQMGCTKNILYPSKCRGQCCLVVMDGCNHVICESCFWQCAVLWEPPIDEGDAEYESKDVICPVCSALSSENKNEIRMFLGEHSLTKIVLPGKHTASFMPLPMTSSEDREKSMMSYLSLPETLPSFGCPAESGK